MKLILLSCLGLASCTFGNVTSQLTSEAATSGSVEVRACDNRVWETRINENGEWWFSPDDYEIPDDAQWNDEVSLPEGVLLFMVKSDVGWTYEIKNHTYNENCTTRSGEPIKCKGYAFSVVPPPWEATGFAGDVNSAVLMWKLRAINAFKGACNPVPPSRPRRW